MKSHNAMLATLDEIARAGVLGWIHRIVFTSIRTSDLSVPAHGTNYHEYTPPVHRELWGTSPFPYETFDGGKNAFICEMFGEQHCYGDERILFVDDRAENLQAVRSIQFWPDALHGIAPDWSALGGNNAIVETV